MKRRELAVLFDEAVTLYLHLTASAAVIYRRGEMSGPRRTVLMALAASAPQTVAQMARARAQSRQRLQPLVNALVREGLLERVENPAHQRSPLLVLTSRGRRAIRQIVETENALRARLRLKSSRRRLTAAATVLREVRLAILDQTEQLIRDLRRARRRASARSSRKSRH